MQSRVAGTVITGIDIPFGQVVALLVKWSIAAIPAALILALVITIGSIVFAGIIGGIFSALK